MPSVQRSHEANLEASRQANFISRMSSFIRDSLIPVVRVHASGDFYDAEYTDKWADIAQRCSDTKFFAYTRSWRKTPETSPELIDAVYRLSMLDNVRLWLSCDRSTQVPPAWPRSPTAYLMFDDADEPKYPVDLVFRDRAKTPMRRTKVTKSLVCPYEQKNSRAAVSCSKCRLCFDNRRSTLKNFDAAFSGMTASSGVEIQFSEVENAQG